MAGCATVRAILFMRCFKKIFWSALFILLGCGTTFSQTPVWSQLPNSPSGTSRHDDIYMLDALNGWSARGRAGPNIFRTTDGGKVWEPQLSKTDTHFRCIAFASPMRGWAGNLGPGSYDGGVTDTNVLFETFDGGTNWSPVPAVAASGMVGLCSLFVLDPQTIYGGGRVRGPAYFLKSTDGGTNWTTTNLTAAGVMGGIMDIYFHDKTNGFVVGMNTNTFATSCASTYYGRIARTTNGGASWFPVATTTLPCCYFWKMSWPTPDVGYVSLQQNADGDTNLNNTLIYYKTTDGGVTWSSNGVPYTAIAPAIATSFNGFYWQGVGFISTNEGWAGGSSLASPNNFLHTTDGGATWTPAGYNNSLSINRIRILSPTLAYASGQKLHVFRIALTNAVPPQSQTNNVGTSATFTVTAYGTAPLGYQWRFNGTNLAGANTNAYDIASVQATNAGDYSVVISDYSGAITSAVATLTVTGVAIAPSITTQPQSVVVNPGSNATFNVVAAGTAPLAYQWRFNNTNLPGTTNTSFTRTNVQSADAGNYSVVVTNSAGSVTSAVATLNLGFADDFDGYTTPSIVTTLGTTNGYKIFYRAAGGGLDFKAIFGFDYSTVTYPTNIPPAPHSTGGTTKGLYLTVNKDGTPAAAAVNLYPVGQSFAGNFALKFDLWINWRDIATSTEHALFGINHSGNVTNRITQSPSDGLFFAVEGEDDSAPDSPTLRDYSVFRGGGSGAPILMITNNTTFGPAPLLGSQFDNNNSGFVALFPPKTIPGFGTTPAGSAGLGWLRGEVRQVNGRITWLLNDTIIAQYPNTFDYTNGTILIGYDDNYSSIGDSNNFAIIDNIRVEPVVIAPVQLLSPYVAGNNFNFSFATEPYESYTVQQATNLIAPIAWVNYTNLLGNGATNDVTVPLLDQTQQYFRVNRP